MRPGGTEPDRALRTQNLGHSVARIGLRTRNVERRTETLGLWHYVLPIDPADEPDDLIDDDPLAAEFSDGFANTADEQPMSFRMHPATHIEIRSGALSGGIIPGIIFRLPVGYRPTQGPRYVTFPSADGSVVYNAKIDIDGDVHILAAIS